MTDPMTPDQGPAAPAHEQPPAPADTTSTSSPVSDTPDPKDEQIAKLNAQVAELQAAAARSAPSDVPADSDPNDTAATTKAPPEVGAVVDHVYFDHYDPATPGGALVHDQVAVVSIEHDDQDRVIGARVMRVEELPLIPLAHLRY